MDGKDQNGQSIQIVTRIIQDSIWLNLVPSDTIRISFLHQPEHRCTAMHKAVLTAYSGGVDSSLDLWCSLHVIK